jgi:hypothetical protein
MKELVKPNQKITPDSGEIQSYCEEQSGNCPILCLCMEGTNTNIDDDGEILF